MKRVDLLLLMRIPALLVALNVALALVKVRVLVRWLTPATLPPRVDLSRVQQAVRQVDGLLRRTPPLFFGHCLLRSLTLYYLCTRLGYPVQIAFGVRPKAGGGMDAHGWLVLEGSAFMERAGVDRHFMPVWTLPELPPPGSASLTAAWMAGSEGRNRS